MLVSERSPGDLCEVEGERQQSQEENLLFPTPSPLTTLGTAVRSRAVGFARARKAKSDLDLNRNLLVLHFSLQKDFRKQTVK